MFLVYEENYLPDCDAADSFELFTTEDNAPHPTTGLPQNTIP